MLTIASLARCWFYWFLLGINPMRTRQILWWISIMYILTSPQGINDWEFPSSGTARWKCCRRVEMWIASSHCSGFISSDKVAIFINISQPSHEGFEHGLMPLALKHLTQLTLLLERRCIRQKYGLSTIVPSTAVVCRCAHGCIRLMVITCGRWLYVGW